MDSVYPEPLSRLHKRAVRKVVRGNAARFKTQPITFSEIQEVDEETTGEEISYSTVATASKSELDLKAKFEEFKRQRDKDLREFRPSCSGSADISFEVESSNLGRKSRSKMFEGCGNHEDTDAQLDLLRNGSTIR